MNQFRFKVKVQSTWANGRPTPEEIGDVVINAIRTINEPPLLAIATSSIWPDDNTVIRYCNTLESAQEYIDALAIYVATSQRSDWSYTIQEGSITGVWDGIGTPWEWPEPWVPAI